MVTRASLLIMACIVPPRYQIMPEKSIAFIRMRSAALATLLVAAPACSPLGVAEALLKGDHFTRTTNVEYGGVRQNRLDVYRPRAKPGPSPVIVFLYGGRWQTGSKEDYQLLGSAFTKRGFVVVVPNYRKYPGAIFPAWIEDAAQAVRWAHQNIRRFGGDSTQLYVVGHSAGAHTAVMLALDRHYLRDAGLPTGAVRGFVSLAGPVDTTWTDPDVQALMGARESWPTTYPRTYVDDTASALLFLHGGSDKAVSPSNSIRLAGRISARGGCARVIVYPGVGHVEIIVALSEPRLGIAPVLTDIISFIAEARTKKCHSS